LLAFALAFSLPLQQIKGVATPQLPLAVTLACAGARSDDNNDDNSWGGKGGDVDYCHRLASHCSRDPHPPHAHPLRARAYSDDNDNDDDWGRSSHLSSIPPEKNARRRTLDAIIVIVVDTTLKTAGKIIAIVVVVVTSLMIMTTMTIAIVIIDMKAMTVDGGP
jgi:hypothetical protein